MLILAEITDIIKCVVLRSARLCMRLEKAAVNSKREYPFFDNKIIKGALVCKYQGFRPVYYKNNVV